jgi:hypothetical protein
VAASCSRAVNPAAEVSARAICTVSLEKVIVQVVFELRSICRVIILPKMTILAKTYIKINRCVQLASLMVICLALMRGMRTSMVAVSYMMTEMIAVMKMVRKGGVRLEYFCR